MDNNEFLTTDDQIADMYAQIDYELTDKSIKKAKSKRVSLIIGNIAFVIVVLILLMTLITVQTTKEKGQTPMIFGYSLQYVKTGSMHPTLPQGSILLAKKPKDTDNLAIGEIITFSIPSGEKVTHRIVETVTIDDQTAYITKGDNNSTIDENPVLQSQIITVFLRRLN